MFLDGFNLKESGIELLWKDIEDLAFFIEWDRK